MKKKWENITKIHIIQAIAKFDSDYPDHPSARNTFLIYNNRKYPAKHIRGMAYEIANNRIISKDDYSGGKETERFFKNLGFKVEYQQNSLTKIKRTSTLKSTNKKLDVVHQKNALQKILQQELGILETEKKFTWLKTPASNSLLKEYEEILENLQNYRGRDKIFKSNYGLLCDYYIDKYKLIIEYDERQHFSTARKISLESYSENIKTYFSIENWINVCDNINAKDNSPVNRDETRAFYDSVRDIESYRHGYKLVRIKHGDYDWESKNAVNHLYEILNPVLNKINVSNNTSYDDQVHTINESLGVKIGRLILNLGVTQSELKHYPNKWIGHKSILVNKLTNNPSKYFERLEVIANELKNNKVDLVLFPACTFVYNKRHNLDVYLKMVEDIPYVVGGTLNIECIERNNNVNNYKEEMIITNYGRIIERFDNSYVLYTQLGKISVMAAISSTITNIHKYLLKPERDLFIRTSMNFLPKEASPVIALDCGHHQYNGRYKLSLQAVQRRLRKVTIHPLVILSYWKYKYSSPNYVWAEYDTNKVSITRRVIKYDLFDIINI